MVPSCLKYQHWCGIAPTASALASHWGSSHWLHTPGKARQRIRKKMGPTAIGQPWGAEEAAPKMGKGDLCLTKGTYFFLWRELPFAIIDGETTSKFFGMNVSPIFHRHIFLNAIHQAPELLFYKLCWHHLGKEVEEAVRTMDSISSSYRILETRMMKLPRMGWTVEVKNKKKIQIPVHT